MAVPFQMGIYLHRSYPNEIKLRQELVYRMDLLRSAGWWVLCGDFLLNAFYVMERK